MIRIAITDDHALFRGGLIRLLETEKDFEIVWEAANGKEALKKCAETMPDVLILDLDMPEMDGFEVAKILSSGGVAPKILILTMHDHEEYAVRLFQAGASGYMIKGSPPSELPGAIRTIAKGKRYIPAEIAYVVAERFLGTDGKKPESSLTDRELQIVIKIVRGESIPEISKELTLSARTIETYKSRAMSKLGVSTTADLVRYALRHGLVKNL